MMIKVVRFRMNTCWEIAMLVYCNFYDMIIWIVDRNGLIKLLHEQKEKMDLCP